MYSICREKSGFRYPSLTQIWRSFWLDFLLSFVVVQSLSHVQLFATTWTAARQTPLCSLLSPRVCSNSCALSWWCHPTTSSFVSSGPQSFPASGSFPMSRLFAAGGQSIRASVLVSVLPMNIQGWFPLRLADLISLLSKWLSRVFSSTTVWKHEFFRAQPSLWSNCHIHTWLLEKP